MTHGEEIKAARRRIVWQWVEGAEKMGIDPETGRYWWQRGKQSSRRCDTLEFVAKWFLRRGYHPDREQSKAQMPVDLLATADSLVNPICVDDYGAQVYETSFAIVRPVTKSGQCRKIA